MENNLNDLTALPIDESQQVIDAPIATPEYEPGANLMPPDMEYNPEPPDMDSKLGPLYNESTQYNPDESAKIQNYAKKLNQPESFIAKNINVAEKFINSPDSEYWNQYEKDYPESAKFLKDQKNMAISHDDHKELAQVEGAVSKASFMATLWNDFTGPGLSSLNAGLLRAPNMIYNIASAPQNLAAQALGRPDLQVSSDGFKGSNPLEKVANYYDSTGVPLEDENTAGIMGAALNGDFSGAGKSLARAFVQNAPSQALNILMATSGLAGPGLALTGVQTSAQAFKASEKSGSDPIARTIDAVSQGAYESLFESLGTFSVVKQWEKALVKNVGKDSASKIVKEFSKHMAASFYQEGSEEFVTQIAQDFSQYATGVNQDAMKGSVGRAADAFLIGGFSGATMTSPGAAISSQMRLSGVKKAQASMSSYQGISDSVEATKTNGRSSEASQANLESQLKGSPIENIHLPAEEMNVYFQSKGMDAAKIYDELGITDKVNEAIETGDKVEIPLATWLSRVDIEHRNGLKEEMSYSYNDQSVAEIKRTHEETKAQLKEMDTQANTLMVEDQTKKEAHQSIYQNVYDQVIKVGTEPKQAANEAKFYADSIVVQAANANQDPMQFFKDQKLVVASGDSHVPIQYNRQAIPKFIADNIVSEDQVSKAIESLNLAQEYKSEEAVSAVRGMLSMLHDEIRQAEAGKRNFIPNETGPTQVQGVESTFPEWAKKILPQGANKKELLKILSSGNSKYLAPLIEQAINALKNGHGENAQFSVAPNLDFVSLVDPSYMDQAFALNQEFQDSFGEGATRVQSSGVEFFQSQKEVRSYIDQEAKGKNIVFTTDSEAPAAEFDKLTGQLTVNSDKINNSNQVKQIMDQFGQAKKEVVGGKIDVNVEGESVAIDAGKLVSEVARKLYNLQRLVECSRG